MVYLGDITTRQFLDVVKEASIRDQVKIIAGEAPVSQDFGEKSGPIPMAPIRLVLWKKTKR